MSEDAYRFVSTRDLAEEAPLGDWWTASSPVEAVLLRDAVEASTSTPVFFGGGAPPPAMLEYFTPGLLRVQPLRALIVEGATTYGESLVQLPDGRFTEVAIGGALGHVEESAGFRSLVRIDDDLYTMARREAPRLVDGTTLFLGGRFLSFYYHWLFESLPKLALVPPEWLATVRVAIPAGVPPPFVETLSWFGVDHDRLVWIDPDRPVRFERVIALPAPAAGETIVRDVYDTLRAKAPPAAGTLRSSRVAVVRRDAPASGRQLLNEEQLIELLARRDFSIVSPGMYSVAEQADLFSHAEQVVAVHGGGAANVVFCPDDCAIVHLHPDEVRYSRAIGLISALRNQRFGYIFGDSFSHPSRTQGVEWLLDLDLVESTLDAQGF